MDLGGRELQRQRAGLDCEVAECKQIQIGMRDVETYPRIK
jgi:hypothetical protein